MSYPALVWGPLAPPPQPVTFTNIAVTIVSSTSVIVSWDVSPNAQGQVEYDTNSGVPYSFASTLETSYLPSHAQLITGLTPGTLHYFRIKGTDAVGTVAYSSEFTFATSGASNFDDGMTYSDVSWASIPVSPADAVTAVEALIASAGSGTDATHPIRHMCVPGALYLFSRAIQLPAGIHDITFEFGGTEGTPGASGSHTGGATWRSTATSGDHQYSLIRSAPNFTGSAALASRIRFHAGTMDRASSGSPAGEHAHGIEAVGWDGMRASYMTFRYLNGDGVSAANSRLFTNPYGAGFYSRDISTDKCSFIKNDRLGVSVIHARGVTSTDDYYEDNGFDIEPDRSEEVSGDCRLIRPRFHNTGAFTPASGLPGLVSITRPSSAPGSFSYVGVFEVIDGTWSGPCPTIGGIYGEIVALWQAPFVKSGAITVTGNRRLDNKHPGPMLRINQFTGGGLVDDNRDFTTAGAFAEVYSSPGITFGTND